MKNVLINGRTLEKPNVALALILAPLSSVLVLMLLAVLAVFSTGEFLSAFGYAINSEAINFYLMFVYPIGLLGCLVILLPLYLVQKWISRHYGLAYVFAGFLGGAFLFWFLFTIALGIWSLEFWSAVEFGQIAETFAESLAGPAPVTGFFGAITAATFFWLLVRTDRAA